MKDIFRNIIAAILILTCFTGLKAQRPSGTLPIIYINTQNRQEITSKDYYLTADCWVDPAKSGYEAIGSENDPVLLQVKGRGNYTWVGFDKKPYRLKFDKKQNMLGMKKSKHFALLAHADDELGFMRNTLGFELSRRLGLPWTPAQQPVELVLNGDYKGIYFLTENIRVDEDRVNIVEQADNISDPEAITGGWLVEIDNYDSDPHVTVYDDGRRWGTDLFFTYKTPEILSAAQEKYLRDQMQMLNDMFVASDKSRAPWTEYVDLDQLVRYYIVQEIMDDAESFHGSCYLYKDLGEKQWKFGPVWDFGNSYRRGDSKYFIYERPPYGQAWIGEIAKFPVFQEKVKEVWAEFVENDYEGLDDYLKDFSDLIASAATNDYRRWPSYGNGNLSSDYDQIVGLMKRRVKWLGEKWGKEVDEPVPDPGEIVIYLRGDFNNWDLSYPFSLGEDGLYYIRNISVENGGFKIGDSEWRYVDYGTISYSIPIYKNTEYSLMKKGENIQASEYPLKNVDFIFDLNKETLLIQDSDYIEPDPKPDPEVTIYLRGDFNNWGLTHPFTKKKDGLYYVTDVTTDVGNGRFKVADSEWSEINLGSNGSKIGLRYPYQLISGTNDNIEPQDGLRLEHMDFIVNLEDLTLTIAETGTMGVDGVAGDSFLTVNGSLVTAPGEIRIYDLTGRLLEKGSGSLEVRSKGMLIVVTGEKSVKNVFN